MLLCNRPQFQLDAKRAAPMPNYRSTTFSIAWCFRSERDGLCLPARDSNMPACRDGLPWV